MFKMKVYKLPVNSEEVLQLCIMVQEYSKQHKEYRDSVNPILSKLEMLTAIAKYEEGAIKARTQFNECVGYESQKDDYEIEVPYDDEEEDE